MADMERWTGQLAVWTASEIRSGNQPDAPAMLRYWKSMGWATSVILSQGNILHLENVFSTELRNQFSPQDFSNISGLETEILNAIGEFRRLLNSNFEDVF